MYLHIVTAHSGTFIIGRSSVPPLVASNSFTWRDNPVLDVLETNYALVRVTFSFGQVLQCVLRYRRGARMPEA